MHIELDQLMLNGFYPRIYTDKIPPERNSKNYIKTYVERKAQQGYLIYAGKPIGGSKDLQILNFKDIQKITNN